MRSNLYEVAEEVFAQMCETLGADLHQFSLNCVNPGTGNPVMIILIRIVKAANRTVSDKELEVRFSSYSNDSELKKPYVDVFQTHDSARSRDGCETYLVLRAESTNELASIAYGYIKEWINSPGGKQGR